MNRFSILKPLRGDLTWKYAVEIKNNIICGSSGYYMLVSLFSKNISIWSWIIWNSLGYQWRSVTLCLRTTNCLQLVFWFCQGAAVGFILRSFEMKYNYQLLSHESSFSNIFCFWSQSIYDYKSYLTNNQKLLSLISLSVFQQFLMNISEQNKIMLGLWLNMLFLPAVKYWELGEAVHDFMVEQRLD